MQKSFETYEQVAQYLLNQMASTFGLQEVEGKQTIKGLSGSDWEIDAKGIKENGEGFVLIECKRYPTSKVKQSQVASLAYLIIRSGAVGGIIVSPLGLQEGAEKVAGKEGIYSVQLNENSTTTSYILKFLNKIFIGVSDTIKVTDSIHIELRDKDGNLKEVRDSE